MSNILDKKKGITRQSKPFDSNQPEALQIATNITIIHGFIVFLIMVCKR